MTPVALSRPRGAPFFPLVEISRAGNLKMQVLVALENQGVTCDRILEIMDAVKADPEQLERWFVVR